MRVLVACEESQEVTKAFRGLGVEAYSCDILPCSGGCPEWHYQQDVLPLLNDNWDLIIAHPPCTYLSCVGTRQFSLKCNSAEKVRAREYEREKAAEFFLEFTKCKCQHVAIENPVGYMNTHFKKPDQIIHPYYFGDPFLKRTCLWLIGLPKLEYTNILEKPQPLYYSQGEKTRGKAIYWTEGIRGITGGQAGRSSARSKTFPGIARAMAEQWTAYLKKEGIQ